MKRLWILIFSLGLASCGDAGEGDHHSHHSHHSHEGGINARFLDPGLNVQEWEERFENETRDTFRHRQAIVDALGLRPGQAIADVGSGTGAFLPALQRKVGPGGKIYAVEISPAFVEHLKERARAEKLDSVEVVQGAALRTNLASDSVDTVLVVDTYHHFDDPGAMLEDLSRILKPAGTLAVIDYDRIPGKSRQWVLDHIRLEKSGFIDEIRSGGFDFIEEKPIPFKESFMLLFRKRD